MIRSRISVTRFREITKREAARIDARSNFRTLPYNAFVVAADNVVGLISSNFQRSAADLFIREIISLTRDALVPLAYTRTCEPRVIDFHLDSMQIRFSSK